MSNYKKTLERRRWEGRHAELHAILWECEEHKDSEGLVALLRGCMDICEKRIAAYQQEDYKKWQLTYQKTMRDLLNNNTEEEE